MTELVDRRLGTSTILFGEGNGRYPDANAVLVEGSECTVLLDTSLGVLARMESLPEIDRILLTHCHEDHAVGLGLFPDATVHVHEEDLHGLQSMDGFIDIFGAEGPERRERMKEKFVEIFQIAPRPDAIPFRDGDSFDLGGGTKITVLHTPGHTRGHCCFVIEPDSLVFLADVDLSGFGPYYGDAWSDLESFEETIRKVRPLEAEHYLTSHHIALLEGRDAYLDRLDRYELRIGQREAALLEFLGEPRTMAEIVDHRFIYRPQNEGENIAKVERRSAELHLARLMRDGAVEIEGEGDARRYRTVRS